MLQARKITIDEFDQLRGEWNALAQTCLSNSVFLSWEWIYCWWKNFSDGRCLCVIEVRDGKDLIGIAPFCYKKMIPLLPFTTIELCSASDLSPDYLDIIAKKGYEKKIIKAVFSYFLVNEKHWVIGNFNNLLKNSVLFKSIDCFRNHILLTKEFSSICPFLTIDGSYDEYMQSKFKRKKRYNLKRELNNLIKKKNVYFYHADSLEEIETNISKFYSLHLKRSKQKKVKSSIADERAVNFIRDFSKRASEKGWLSIFFLVHQSEAIGALFCLQYNRKLLYYQSGIDPVWKKFGVGSALIHLVIRYAFENQFQEFDFLKGDETYKKTWATVQREQYRILFFRNNLFGKYFYFVYRIMNSLKGWLKSALGVMRSSL